MNTDNQVNKEYHIDSSSKKRIHFDNAYFSAPSIYENIVLYQIGDLACEGGYRVGEHQQECYEISYVVSGKGAFYTNGVKYTVKKGDIFFSRPGEVHDCVADKIDPFRYFYIGYLFKPSENSQYTMELENKMLEKVKHPVLQDKFHIDVPFINIFKEIIHTNSFMDIMIKTYLHQIIIIAYRNFFERWEREYKPDSEQKGCELVYDVINYIDTHIKDITNLTDVAHVLGYSYSHLSHVFTQETGISIKEYYQKKRFEEAVDMLKDSNLNITQIAGELGYKSIHTFSRAFRQNFGMSPTAYQELYSKMDVSE